MNETDKLCACCWEDMSACQPSELHIGLCMHRLHKACYQSLVNAIAGSTDRVYKCPGCNKTDIELASSLHGIENPVAPPPGSGTAPVTPETLLNQAGDETLGVMTISPEGTPAGEGGAGAAAGAGEGAGEGAAEVPGASPGGAAAGAVPGAGEGPAAGAGEGAAEGVAAGTAAGAAEGSVHDEGGAAEGPVHGEGAAAGR